MSISKPASKIRIKKCILGCKTDAKLFSFPDKWDTTKEWLKILGVSEMPTSRPKLYICIKHFSSRQLIDNGRRITPISVPDINIPGKQNPPEDEIEEEFPLQNSYNNILDTSNSEKQFIMITSAISKCFLKCKSYRSLHRFPNDLVSYQIWLGKLGIPETAKLYRTTSLCSNHFSPAMRTLKTISKCAVPDIYLPSQCKFIDEIDATQSEINDFEETYGNHSVECLMTNRSSTQEIIPNSHNFESDHQKTKNVKLAVLPISMKPQKDVYPQDPKNGLHECVLKCSDFKVLYRFPVADPRRQKWLRQVGLTNCYCTTRICNKHFSEKMIANKRLTNSSYPDINLPTITQAQLDDMPPDLRPNIYELPQHICVLTVFTHKNRTEKDISNTMYLEYSTNKKIPMRERGIQTDENDIFNKIDIGISVDDDSIDEDEDMGFEIVQNLNFDQQPNLIREKFNAQVYATKSKNMFECLKCGEISPDQESNLRHLDFHNELILLCFYCGLIFTNKLKLKKHERNVHNSNYRQLLRCPKRSCHKAFYSRRNLYQHLDEHIQPSRHFCLNCGRLFFSSLKLQCHLLACRLRNKRSKVKE